MKKKYLLIFVMAATLVMGGCSTIAPKDPLADLTLTESSSEDVAQAASSQEPSETSSEENSSEDISSDITSTEDSSSDSTEDTTEKPENVISTDDNGNIVIDIKPDETLETSSTGRMEDIKKTYTQNNITINYPVIVGMSDSEIQEWANAELYKDAMSIIDIYDVDVEKDTLTIDYEVSVIYRSEFSLVYSGTLEPDGNSAEAVKIRLSDDLDLAGKKHVRLSDRLSATKLVSTILEGGEYTVTSSNFDEDTLREYLSKQTEAFYTDLIKTADFGGDESPVGFSYNSMGNVAVIIPVPHMFGDYAEISIKQQTK